MHGHGSFCCWTNPRRSSSSDRKLCVGRPENLLRPRRSRGGLGSYNSAKLVDLQIPPQLVASLAMVPLVEVAWADGNVGSKEREVIIREAHIDSEVDKTIIERWLTHRPEPALLEAWVHYVEGLCENLDDNDRKALKDSIMEPDWAVARAEGGVLGPGNKVSTAEREVLGALEAAFAMP